jgi:hypothetical protein
LTRLRALPPDVVQKGPTLVPEAIKLLAQQNFAQVIRLLDCIPPEFRPPEAVSVLQQARTLQGEVEQTGIPEAAGFTPAEQRCIAFCEAGKPCSCAKLACAASSPGASNAGIL